mmetsp:Transcript_3938/g.5447  ORF Transcript_3938/g.5447 Transcript_3938/m.5447 type:complete len:341 (-) Transcript_3938:40-1062(-)|eukprot:CAMPEP_0170080678 /NCGR_PEP_ID=MMETSP0019_2-20121128/16753_1 /TAXON_ID=98059 /ORGANISM="Dinobryon sp., Strain UTEXLB2267" /LENGTH=340 /DNA_ID=CAMNT_0010294763 /DNA_START=42 /DNA_END=1064 /DNA_ORIENTATION=-
MKVGNDINSININLQKALSISSPAEEMVDMLNILKGMPVPSVQLLRDTKVGCTLQKVSKVFKGTSTGTLARSIIRSWKVSISQEESECSSSPNAVVSIDNQSTNNCRKSTRESKPVLTYSEETLSSTKKNKVGTKLAGLMTIVVLTEMKPLPQRNANNELLFPDFPTFRPNLTPKEILQAGSFGGTYFRPIKSGVTGLSYCDVWKEFPADWFEGLNIKRQVTNSVYVVDVNKYKQHCGGDLHMWESSGWITEVDPYGWFQWYCRFYLGRRCSDDERQISRGLGVIGPTGRWRRNLINKCIASGKKPEESLNDMKISPKVRQLLQHWGYALTLKDLKSAAK